jgi:hypothetical protein
MSKRTESNWCYPPQGIITTDKHQSAVICFALCLYHWPELRRLLKSLSKYSPLGQIFTSLEQNDKSQTENSISISEFLEHSGRYEQSKFMVSIVTTQFYCNLHIRENSKCFT